MLNNCCYLPYIPSLRQQVVECFAAHVSAVNVKLLEHAPVHFCALLLVLFVASMIYCCTVTLCTIPTPSVHTVLIWTVDYILCITPLGCENAAVEHVQAGQPTSLHECTYVGALLH